MGCMIDCCAGGPDRGAGAVSMAHGDERRLDAPASQQQHNWQQRVPGPGAVLTCASAPDAMRGMWCADQRLKSWVGAWTASSQLQNAGCGRGEAL
jgi:hypothetical protein